MTDKPVPEPSELSAPYWEAAARGELVAQRCEKCGTHFLYVRDWCPECGSADITWSKTKGRGRIHSFSVIYHAPYPAFETDVPYAIAVVLLQEGAQLMTNIVECDLDKVHVGQDVEVTFEKRGDIVLPQFRPVTDTKDRS